MTTAETLRAAKAKIKDPAHWTQKTSARDATGRPVHPRSPRAVCWCAGGAIFAVNDSGYESAYLAFSAAVSMMSFTVFNDTHTHAEVLAGFDRAIEAESRRE